MATILGEFRVGEDVLIGLDAPAALIADVSSISALMRPVRLVGTAIVIEPGDPIVVDITDRADGWTMLVVAAVTANFEPGLYAIDARLVIGSGVEITERSALLSLSRAMVP